MKYLFCLLFFIHSFSARAEEMTMALITSDIDRNTTEFLMEVDENDSIHSIRIRTTTPQGRIIEDFSHTAEQVMEGGVVLHERDGYKAVRLKVEQDFSPATGGGVVLDYLYSGISGARYFLSLKLAKTNSTFSLQRVNGDPINRFFFRANRHPLLGIIGVKEIQLSYRPQ